MKYNFHYNQTGYNSDRRITEKKNYRNMSGKNDFKDLYFFLIG